MEPNINSGWLVSELNYSGVEMEMRKKGTKLYPKIHIVV
jgi:hypothetical protein